MVAGNSDSVTPTFLASSRASSERFGESLTARIPWSVQLSDIGQSWRISWRRNSHVGDARRGDKMGPHAAAEMRTYEFFLDAGATNLELTKVRSTQAHSAL